LLSIFWSHPRHPVDKGYRFIMFVRITAASFYACVMMRKGAKIDGLRDFNSAQSHALLSIVLALMSMSMLAEASIQRKSLMGCKDRCCNAGCVGFCCCGCCCSADPEQALRCMGKINLMRYMFESAMLMMMVSVEVKSLSKDLVIAEVYSQSLSLVMWFPLKLLMPCVGFLWSWRKQRGILESASEA